MLSQKNYRSALNPDQGKQKILFALAAGFALFLILSTIILFSFQMQYLGRVYPGVHIAGLDVSGIRRTELPQFLEENLTYSAEGLILLRSGELVWMVSPAELGLILDEQQTVEDAYLIGRSGFLWTRLIEQYQTWEDSIDLPPLMRFDQNIAQARLEEIANEINTVIVEAELHVNGQEVQMTPGQVGEEINIPGTLILIQSLLHSLQDGIIDMEMLQYQPLILDVSEQAALAESILSQDLIITLPGAEQNDPGPWTLTPQTLAGMITIERLLIDGELEYQVGLDSNQLRAFLSPIAPGLAREAVNGRFIFNDETRELDIDVPAVVGRELMVEESIQEINQRLAEGHHQINLVFAFTNPPAPSEATAADLGITELVSVQTTYFYGSSSGRIQNIQTASANFHGLLIAPGATFSMVEYLGDISLDSGYAEALIIYGNRTIQGVGGGVCQVSTTLFRTVFFGGFPVVTRYSHAYRVYYYELNAGGGVNANMAGLDATVYSPVVDFQFTNDTPYWLLMEVYVNPTARSITWKFYSTSDGRTVEWETSGLRNVVEPPEIVYEENDEFQQGEVQQVDWAVEGADVTITRVVYRDGTVYFQDSFSTHYLPWGEVWEYGPGTEGYPPDENGNNNNDD